MSAVFREAASLTREAKDNFLRLFQTNGKKRRRGTDDDQESDSSRVGVEKVYNPVEIWKTMDRQTWVMLLGTSFLLSADYFDYYSLSISTVKLAAYFHTTKTKISEAITFTMLTRGLGAILFGFYGDFVGRKWPLVAACVLLGIFQIASIYCKSLNAFLACRSLFGVALGGIWGLSAAGVMEKAPLRARGFMSGFMASCSSVAFIAASGANLGFGPSPESWKKLFWIGAGLSFSAGAVRALMPESDQYQGGNTDAVEIIVDADGVKRRYKKRRSKITFIKNVWAMIKADWRIFIYCVGFATIGLYFGSAVTNTYTTFLVAGKGLSNSQASRAGMIMKTGGVIGCNVSGYISESFGRRRTIVCMGILACAAIPALVLPTSMIGLAFGGWTVMLFTHGMSGVYPAHLNELFHPSFRGLLPGLAFSLGSSFASPAAEIVNSLAEKHSIIVHGKKMPAYGPVIGIMLGILGVLKVIWVAFGPERRGRHIEKFVPAAYDTSLASSKEDLNKVSSIEEESKAGLSKMSSLEEDVKEDVTKVVSAEDVKHKDPAKTS